MGLFCALIAVALESIGGFEWLRSQLSTLPALPRIAAVFALAFVLFAPVGWGVSRRFASRLSLDSAPGPQGALALETAGELESERDLDPEEGSGGSLERTPITPLDTSTMEENNQRLETQLQQLTLLHEVTRSLTMTLEIDELLRRLTELLGKNRKFESFAILLADEEQTGLAVRSTFGFEPHLDPTGLRLPLTDETSGAVMQSRTHATTRAILPLDRTRLEGLGWRPGDAQILALAMRHKDRVEGILVFARRPDEPFTGEDVQLLHNIAGQAALALSNARLFEQTVKLSLTDPLTGLHNRRHFFARLDLEIMRARRYGSPVSVAMFDIDHFKNLNDTHGHAAGDVVLQELGHHLQRNVRRVDIVARFGGEEFCVILPSVTKEEAGIASEKLRRLIAETPFPGGDTQPGGRLTVSVGYATLPGDADDVDSLLDAADTALYASKHAGRNRSTPYQEALRERDPRLPSARIMERVKPREPETAKPLELEAGGQPS